MEISEAIKELRAIPIKREKALKMAIEALEKQDKKHVEPHKRIRDLCKCPVCKTELCWDDEQLHYCPTCGQALAL